MTTTTESKCALHTSFARLHQHGACKDGYQKLARHLGGVTKYGKNTPIALSAILETDSATDVRHETHRWYSQYAAGQNTFPPGLFRSIRRPHDGQGSFRTSSSNSRIPATRGSTDSCVSGLRTMRP